MDLHRVLQKPLVTEKTTQMLEEANCVAFQVNTKANKLQIKQAVEEIFSVTVLSVNTAIVRGKKRRFGRVMGVGKNWKKAVLKLKAGDKIEMFEGA